MLSSRLNLFTNYVKINNRIIGSIPFKHFFDKIIDKPNIQRIVDKEKVDEIVSLQDNYYKSGKHCFNFLGTINIHCCEETKKNYLVDGQHRYQGAKKLFDEHNYKNEDILVELVNVETLEEVKHNYRMINKNTELPEFPEEIDKDIPEKTAEFFFEKYPGVWKSTKTTPRPHINRNKFQEALGYLTLKYEEIMGIKLTSEKLKELVEEKNSSMSDWPIESYVKHIRKIKNMEKYKIKADKFKLYLGMYAHTSEEYIYDWVAKIIAEKTGEIIAKKKKYRKKKITKSLRAEVWRTYMGDVGEGPCFCCRKNNIKALDGMECGHVKAETNGGETTLENLRPICKDCNKNGNGGMGIKHMRDYIKEKFPENLEAFDNNVSPVSEESVSEKEEEEKEEEEENETSNAWALTSFFYNTKY